LSFSPFGAFGTARITTLKVFYKIIKILFANYTISLCKEVSEAVGQAAGLRQGPGEDLQRKK
jgi:hypothetical protein